MLFSSLIFIFAFLPLFLAAYYVTPKKWRNLTALVFSYAFYAWGAPTFVFVLFGASVLDYWFGKCIALAKEKKQKQWWLAVSLIINVGLLGYFKYANFFVDQWNQVFEVFGATGIHWTAIALPIGISFFTFQKISYIVDVYRETTKPAKNFISFALYVALFPQLIAGPIVRYFDIDQQLRQRTYSREQFFQGIWRFTVGLGKKVLIANYVGQIADATFGLSGADLTTGYAWIGILAYTMQIYFDFSGYSDMAIGLGKMMGFDFMENFNKPYISRTFTEFWRRWHISLSNWMKEYLYIPLGGNRVPTYRMYFNLWVVFLISGLWHGAAWTFVIWGAYHGFFLMLDKLFWMNMVKKLQWWITVPLNFFLVMIGWVFFRADTISDAWRYLGALFSGQTQTYVLFPEIATNRSLIILMIALLLSFIVLLPGWQRFADWWIAHIEPWQQYMVQTLLILIIFVLSVISLANASFNPFIYFRF